MQYLDDLYTRLAIKCLGPSPSEGYYGPFVVGITVDITDVTADDTLITADLTLISVDEEI
jgi:hypothetical protein